MTLLRHPTGGYYRSPTLSVRLPLPADTDVRGHLVPFQRSAELFADADEAERCRDSLGPSFADLRAVPFGKEKR